jgi:hypothetical protein
MMENKGVVIYMTNEMADTICSLGDNDVGLEGLLYVRFRCLVLHLHFLEAETKRIELEELNGVSVIHIECLGEIASDVPIIRSGNSIVHLIQDEQIGGFKRRRTASTTLKIAVFAPMPRARVSTATVVKPGDFASIRNPCRKSCQRVCIDTPPESAGLKRRYDSEPPLC